MIIKVLMVFGVSVACSSSNFNRINGGGYWSLSYYHHMVPAAQVNETQETSSMCNCKSLCLMKSCATVSMVKTSSGNFICNVSMTQISVMKLEKIEQGLTFAHREDEYFLGSDGVFYEVEKSPKNHENSKKFCEDKYEIGSLIMPKTLAQMQGILEYRQKIGATKSGSYFLINLTYDPERGEAVWEDGTLYKDSEISKYIDLETSETDTYYREVMRNQGGNYFNSYNEKSWVMCQLKPLP